MIHLISVTLLFSVVCGVEAYIPHRYHFVNENKTWTEAQTYCREKYTDLTSINNMEEMKELNNILKKETVKKAWIGLKREGTGVWKWSLPEQTLYRDGDTYRNWAGGQPNNRDGNEYCVVMEKSTGRWHDYPCDVLFPVVCEEADYHSFTLHGIFEGTTNNHSYIFINESINWYEALIYCRENHTDLVTVRNQTENNQIWSLIKDSSDGYVWIGLFEDSWKWSDESKSSFRYWSSDNLSGDMNCTVVSESEPHYWSNVSCTETHPFICHENRLILINQSLSWWEALNYCRNHHHDLVSVRTEEMQLWVKDVLQNASTGSVWLGLRHDCIQRIWFWVFGSMICYDNWAPGNGTWNEDCSHEKRSGAVQAGGEQQWIDLPESYRLNFICSTYEDIF